MKKGKIGNIILSILIIFIDVLIIVWFMFAYQDIEENSYIVLKNKSSVELIKERCSTTYYWESNIYYYDTLSNLAKSDFYFLCSTYFNN